ncbi:hypothetical protein SESBI_26244, partial [Sesbania bispinosa]
MKEYLDMFANWCLEGAMMAQYFTYIFDELAVLPYIKKDFQVVSAKLKSDEVKMTEAIAKVKTLTDDRDKLEAGMIVLQQKLASETAEKIKVFAEAKKEASTLELEKEDRDIKEKQFTVEIERLRKLWEESTDVYFHAAIKQIKFLNPIVEFRTRGMSTLCQVQD